MKKLLYTLLFVLMFSVCLMGVAFADIAVHQLFYYVIGIPVLVIAVAVIAIVLIVKAVRKKRAAQVREHEEQK